jgi:hypothetical protein
MRRKKAYRQGGRRQVGRKDQLDVERHLQRFTGVYQVVYLAVQGDHPAVEQFIDA